MTPALVEVALMPTCYILTRYAPSTSTAQLPGLSIAKPPCTDHHVLTDFLRLDSLANGLLP